MIIKIFIKFGMQRSNNLECNDPKIWNAEQKFWNAKKKKDWNPKQKFRKHPKSKEVGSRLCNRSQFETDPKKWTKSEILQIWAFPNFLNLHLETCKLKKEIL